PEAPAPAASSSAVRTASAMSSSGRGGMSSAGRSAGRSPWWSGSVMVFLGGVGAVAVALRQQGRGHLLFEQFDARGVIGGLGEVEDAVSHTGRTHRGETFRDLLGG